MSNQWRVAVLGPALAAAMILAMVQWESLVRMERPSGAEASGYSVDSRASFSYVSWKMFLDRPLLGVGYGQFQRAAQPYLSDRSMSLYLESIRGQPNHNMFLALLTETGLIGAGLFVAILAGWASRAWQMWHNTATPDWVRWQGLTMLGMLGIYLGTAMFFDLTFSPQDNCILFFVAGLTASLWPKSSRRAGGC